MRTTALTLLLTVGLLPALGFSAFWQPRVKGLRATRRQRHHEGYDLRPNSAIQSADPNLCIFNKIALLSGGGAASVDTPMNSKAVKIGWASSWGVLSVLAIFANAARRLGPVAIEPLQMSDKGGLTTVQWVCYAGCTALIGYMKGERAIRRKFSRHVVQRALTLDQGEATPLRVLLAGPYSMGLFRANRRRKASSWGMLVAAVGIIKVIKKMPYPWRSIVDAGVLAGLCWGGGAVAYYWVRSWSGINPGVDPQMPKRSEAAATE
ncbi:hypothetical protein JKP88DRAFT_351952 [Tribonema minus]|uniref:Uncharacterized protein n=1 Tax=Tribonema minus TaxID=303371 RepID=A0A836CMT5_9STRA|nr:hypothetical protein JKP88DRAFT_351952 [Tribonema minus]